MPMLPATMLGVAVLLAWPGLAIFGTLLPAAAAGQPLAPRRALAAARLTAATLAWQLPLLTGVSFALLLLLAQWAAPLILPFGMSGPATLLVEMLFTALGFLPSLVTAVLLSRAYARGWPRD